MLDCCHDDLHPISTSSIDEHWATASHGSAALGGREQLLEVPLAHRHMLSSVRRNLSPNSPLGTKLTVGQLTTGSRRRLASSCCSMRPRASAAWTAAVQTSSRACKQIECSSCHACLEEIC